MSSLGDAADPSAPVRLPAGRSGHTVTRVRDKVLAAHRAGIKTVILPAGNRKDLEEIPETVRKGLRIVFVDHVDEVIDLALVKKKTNRKRSATTNGHIATPKPAMRMPVSSIN